MLAIEAVSRNLVGKHDRGRFVATESRDILRWLDRATNATLEPGSTEMTWKK